MWLSYTRGTLEIPLEKPGIAFGSQAGNIVGISAPGQLGSHFLVVASFLPHGATVSQSMEAQPPGRMSFRRPNVVRQPPNEYEQNLSPRDKPRARITKQDRGPSAMYHHFKWTPVSNRRNWISREYEPLQPYFLLELARATKTETFVDVGANVGLYSVMMSQLSKRIIAYEANGALAKEIGSNFRLNGIDGTIRQVAVSDRPGFISFGVASRFAGNSAVIQEKDGAENYNSVETVEAVCLDEELAGVEGPVALKVDVEGHELPVLRGARSILERLPCILQIENFDAAVDQFMADLNYRKLTSIGPDSYFTNIEHLEPVDIYERAATALINANHENKSMVIGRGSIRFVVTGRPYRLVRSLAQKLLRGRL